MHEPGPPPVSPRAPSARAFPALALLAACWWAAAPAGATEPVVTAGGVRLLLPAEPAALLVEYDRVDGLTGRAEPLPRLRIYADGRALVHQPPFRVDAGDWELRLETRELQALLAELAACRLTELSTDSLQQAKLQALRERAEAGRPIMLVADGTLVRIGLHFAVSGPGEAVRAPDPRTIQWRDVQEDARWHPEIAGLQCLARADRALRAVLEREDKSPVASSAGDSPVEEHLHER